MAGEGDVEGRKGRGDIERRERGREKGRGIERKEKDIERGRYGEKGEVDMEKREGEGGILREGRGR